MKFIFPVFFCIFLCLISCKDRESDAKIILFNADSITTRLIAKENWLGVSRLSSGIYSHAIYQNPSATAPSVSSGLVVFYRYELKYVEVSDTSLSAPIVSFEDQTRSAVQLTDANAVFPVGLDQALLDTSPKESDTIQYILPPELAYGESSLPSFLPANSIVSIVLVIDSIKTVSDVLGLETQKISNYIIAANLNDTSIVEGGFVGSLSNNLVRFKLLTDTLTGALPQDGNLLVLQYTLRNLDSAVLDGRYTNSPISLVLGQDLIIPGLEVGIRNMHVGEEALLLINPSAAYQESVALLPHFKSYESLYSSFTGFYDYLLQSKIIPEYGVRIHPYQSLVFQVRLVAIN